MAVLTACTPLSFASTLYIFKEQFYSFFKVVNANKTDITNTFARSHRQDLLSPP